MILRPPLTSWCSMSLEPLRSSNVGRFPYVQKTGWPLLESTGEALVTRHCNQKQSQPCKIVNRHSTVTHYQRPNMTHPQEGGTGGEVSEILFFSAKSKRRPSLIYSMQIIPVCLSIVARRKGVSATRRGGLNWTPISLLVGHPCKLFHKVRASAPIPSLMGPNYAKVQNPP